VGSGRHTAPGGGPKAPAAAAAARRGVVPRFRSRAAMSGTFTFRLWRKPGSSSIRRLSSGRAAAVPVRGRAAADLVRRRCGTAWPAAGGDRVGFGVVLAAVWGRIGVLVGRGRRRTPGDPTHRERRLVGGCASGEWSIDFGFVCVVERRSLTGRVGVPEAGVGFSCLRRPVVNGGRQ